MYKILAIETSCDETAAAVIEDGRKILSNIVYSQADIHATFGGVVPEIASRKHIEALTVVTDEALKKAGICKTDLSAIAVTSCPGLVGALLTGVSFAKALAFGLNIPLISVHHIKGHIAANYLADESLKPPFLCLVVSGGHSQIVYVSDYLDFEILAKTRDDAAGEAFDKAARVFGLPYPGGVKLDVASKSGDPAKITFTKPKMGDTDDFSFSGIKTAVNCYINKIIKKPIEEYNDDEFLTTEGFSGLGIKVKEGGITKADVMASFSNAMAEMLTTPFFRIAKEKNVNTVCMAGGVSANSYLREMFFKKAKENGLYAVCPPLDLCGDNGAMIGSHAYYEYINGNFADATLNARPYVPIDEK